MAFIYICRGTPRIISVLSPLLMPTFMINFGGKLISASFCRFQPYQSFFKENYPYLKSFGPKTAYIGQHIQVPTNVMPPGLLQDLLCPHKQNMAKFCILYIVLQNGKLHDALENLLALEKQTRNVSGSYY